MKRYETWVIATISGAIPADSREAKAFLEVHSGNSEPESEVEVLWSQYWDGRIPTSQELADRYIKRAITAQENGSSYEDIVHSYRLANLLGVTRARDWLREQKLQPLKINSIWNSNSIDVWDVNG